MSTQTYAQGYSYDLYGNRTQSANATLGLPAVSASDYDTTNNNNRFVSSVATYDAAGNITSDAKFRSLTYTYDANGRQKTASNGAWTQTQVYDCAGQRVQTTVGLTTRTMVYDAFGQNVAEYSGAALERENIYRGGVLLAVYEAASSALRYVLTDVQGSTRALLNSSGAVLARHDYLPFGEEIASGIGLRTSGQGFGATDTNRQKYGLIERDDTSGLDHTWWRKYENRSGRWTSPDPLRGRIGAPQSFNAYTYAANDPVNFVDPSGLDPQGALGGLLGQIPNMGPGTSIVTVPIGWGDPIARHGGSSGDGTEWVTLAVIDPNARLAAAIAELKKRLEANNGDNPCANLFGGLKNALKRLDESKITFRSMGGPVPQPGNVVSPNGPPDAITNGKKITINTDGRFMADNGTLRAMGRPDLIVPNVNKFGLDDVASAALILGHELGHRTGKLEDEEKAKDPEGASDRNDQRVYDACFAE